MTATEQPGPAGLLAWEHERFERVTGELDLWAQNHPRVSWSEAEERRLVLERLDRSRDLIAAPQPFERWRTGALAMAISRDEVAQQVRLSRFRQLRSTRSKQQNEEQICRVTQSTARTT